MAKVSEYPEVTDPSPDGWLFIAERQPDGSFQTKKVSPDNIGLQGPTGPQGLTGPSGAGVAGPPGAPGTPGTNGTNGTNGAAGATGATGAAGSAGQDEVTNLDGHATDTFEDNVTVAAQFARTNVGFSGASLATGASLVTRSLIIGTEQRLSIASGEIIRQLRTSSRWNKIQIALLLRINGGVTFAGEYFVGMCSGVAAGYGSAGCVNAIGISSRPFNGNAFTFAASPNAQMNQFGASFLGFESKRGVVISNATGGSGTAGNTWSATESYRSMLLLEIVRPIAATTATSVSYTLTAKQTAATTAEYDIARREFFTVLETGEGTSLGILTAGTQTAAFNFDESTGVLDSVNIYWPNATPLEISAMSVRKFY